MADLLIRMCLQSEVVEGGSRLKVRIPPTRHDIIQTCDIIEDVAIAYGYNRIPQTLPSTATVAAQFPLNKLTDSLRLEMACCGFTEPLTFSLVKSDSTAQLLDWF